MRRYHRVAEAVCPQNKGEKPLASKTGQANHAVSIVFELHT